MDACHKLSQMFGESFGNHLVKLVVFISTEKAQATSALFPLADQPSGVHGHSAIANALPIAKETKAL